MGLLSLIALPLNLSPKRAKVIEQGMVFWPFGPDSARDWIRAGPVNCVTFLVVCIGIVAEASAQATHPTLADTIGFVMLAVLAVGIGLAADVILFNRPKFAVASFRRDEVATFARRMTKRSRAKQH